MSPSSFNSPIVKTEQCTEEICCLFTVSFVFSWLITDPPGAPEITGYIEGETIRLGQTVTLICTAKGGNPLAQITWYRNGIKVDDSFTSSGRASSNTYSFMAATEDNNARYRCESTNELSPTPLQAEIILSVQCKSYTHETPFQNGLIRHWKRVKRALKMQNRLVNGKTCCSIKAYGVVSPCVNKSPSFIHAQIEFEAYP